ncbi:LytR family transcriptional regulator [Flavobacterium sp. 9AF]|uniref:LytTR family DNA-binding domain-containing protein n=1 Tax=Flavobacterium sp. 9AF TaxID=2653142 RepID=UPI0012F2770F|nr:LytTR family DNA-binding domain-containing protein [Flavobacterium sp. 9AF]VXB58443.1 LytR family transcriptional regulator [Flavobacterium sp. 9AF]
MNDLKKYFDQPYLYYYSGKKLLQISLLLFSLSFLFNYVIQPFEMNHNELKLPFFIVALIHSITPIFILFVLASISNQYPKTIENWTVKKELLLISILLFLTGIAHFLLRDVLYNNPFNGTLHYLFEEVFHALLIGLLLAFGVISANLNIHFLKNSEKASELNCKLKDKEIVFKHSEIEIETDVKSEAFTLVVENFIFAKAEGNYIEIWMTENEITKPFVKRMKLKDLENYLFSFPEIFKTHRSYLLNSNFIKNVKGNAQGYKIQLKNCEEQVPVSRNYLSFFDDKMNS